MVIIRIEFFGWVQKWGLFSSHGGILRHMKGQSSGLQGSCRKIYGRMPAARRLQGEDEAMSWILTAKSGLHRGVHWAIAPEPLVIGRGLGCDIVISDPVVSRRHCRVYQRDDAVHVEDLGSSHLTLINGEAVEKGVVGPGDTITLGNAIFMVTQGTAPAQTPLGPKLGDVTLSLFDHAVEFNREDLSATLLEGKPQSIAGLVELFTLGRALSQCTRRAELHEHCLAAIALALSPDSTAIALRGAAPKAADAQGAVLWHPEHIDRDGCFLSALDKVLGDKKALLTPIRTREQGARGLDLIMAAPLCIGGEAIGAFILRSAARQRPYDESDLHLFLSIAQLAAPYYQTLGHVDALKSEVTALDESPAGGWPLLGKSRAIKEARGLIRDMARTPLNVLITGETGTGKELAAQMLHEGSPRAAGPLISVNCAAIPDHLFESEMFGHEKGAFTSADKKRLGRFALANLGTLFLDEIGELSSENQARLLRVLERGVFHPVGAERESHADVRVIAATNRDLKRAIQDGRFRRDLYHRICAVEIELPPLRQRPSDIPLLAQHFFHDYTTRNKHARLGISPEAMERLEKAPWPGNVRELRNAIERATALAKSDYITPQDLHFLSQSVSSHDDPDHPHGNALLALAEVERQHIVKVLEACGFNVSAAARVLGVHRNTLHNKIAEYGIGG
jgi:two-component system response regulator HydG